MDELTPIRIALIDDHPIVQDGLMFALARYPRLQIVGQARSVTEGRALLADTAIDVALVDIRLPDGLGLTLVREANARQTPLTIVLSSFDLAQYVTGAIEAGAQGFLLKTTPAPEIVEGILRVAAGGTVFTAAQLRAPTGGVSLTPRERAVVRLVLQSRSNDEIARSLGVATKTVETYLSRLYEKTGSLSRLELALRAERESWLASVE